VTAPDDDEVKRGGAKQDDDRRRVCALASVTWSTGIISCSAARPRSSAISSIVSIDVPSTSVWQASRRRPKLIGT
jgi:hypothetical protein